MEPAEFVCAPLIGFKLEGNCKPISVLMIAAAKSSAKKIMRLAKPSVRPIPTSTAIDPTNPHISCAGVNTGGKTGQIRAASSAPKASRN